MSEPTKRVKVSLEVTETVSFTVETEVEVPADIADDKRELLDYLEENDSGWIDEIDPSQQQVKERSIDSVRIL